MRPPNFFFPCACFDRIFHQGMRQCPMVTRHLNSQNTARLPEVRTIGQLRGFPKDKSPPLVYMTGERSISISQREMEALREYLVDKQGMIFADNGGSSGWHSQFFSLMRRVLPNVNP
ncbi:MAG TPA: DUF4159 domain-containing protein, partial [Sulfitobacter sp.]|nr:DUF4159 domain-containing protein [Sulfitobacter sp.]